MNRLLVPIRPMLTAILLSGLALTAHASSTWNSSQFTCGNDTAFGNRWAVDTTCGSGNSITAPYEVAASAWSTATAATGIPATETAGSSTTPFTTAQLIKYSGGFGVSNRDEGLYAPSDQHTVDNSAAVDLVAFDFGSAKVMLESITIGYVGDINGQAENDSDLSLLAWTGAGAPNLTTALQGQTIASLVTAGSGWTWVGNYNNLGVNTARNVNTGVAGTTSIGGQISSSWWLVSAFSTAFPGSDWTVANDSFKIKSLSGMIVPPEPANNAPEPGSLALMGVALVGFVATRRRKLKPT